jgi:hypothetical protein
MLAFVDESGDAGRKVGAGSSKYFVIAIVIFEDRDEADRCDRRIDALRNEIDLPPGYEFHFAHNSHRVRKNFLGAVTPFRFVYHVFALNKDPAVLTGRGFNYPESLYKYTAGVAFENASADLRDAIVVIDESGDRRFRDELSRYLSRRLKDSDGHRRITRVKTQRSAGNNLLQLADYVAGISNRALIGKRNGERYRHTYLAQHEKSLRIWP